MTNTEIIKAANNLSELFIANPKEACSLMAVYIKRYGSECAATIGKLMDIYTKVKRGQMGRDEAAEIQGQILEEVTQ